MGSPWNWTEPVKPIANGKTAATVPPDKEPEDSMSDGDNLGRVAPWQIREFPEKLREDIIRQAKEEKVSVSEFVTAHFVALRDAGWVRGGASNGLQTVKRPQGIDRIALLTAVTALASATQSKIPGASSWAAAMVREARGLPPLPVRLTGPKRIKA